uniref:Insulin 1 n=1 Tax=Deroceras reticulatum TaxID=145610 RepID=A0A1X9ZND9_DERRE|nr:insulin 1 [Deroceras reticulatum]
MTGNVEHYTSLTAVLITISLLIYQAQGQSRSCSLLSRPHPNGFCGEKLAAAHRNLCFLIRRSYPEFFPMVKRSVPRSDEGNIDQSEFAELDAGMRDNGLTSYKHNQLEETSSPLPDLNKILISSMTPKDVSEYSTQNLPGSDFLDLLVEKAPRKKRSLVCECCYGPCTVRIIARYC